MYYIWECCLRNKAVYRYLDLYIFVSTSIFCVTDTHGNIWRQLCLLHNPPKWGQSVTGVAFCFFWNTGLACVLLLHSGKVSWMLHSELNFMLEEDCWLVSCSWRWTIQALHYSVSGCDCFKGQVKREASQGWLISRFLPFWSEVLSWENLLADTPGQRSDLNHWLLSYLRWALKNTCKDGAWCAAVLQIRIPTSHLWLGKL